MKNSAARITIFRLLCLVIIVAGLKVACSSGPAPLTKDDYQKQMIGLAADFSNLEKSGQDAVTKIGDNPTKLLQTLEDLHSKKSADIKKMQTLVPPDQYKELHDCLLEWKQKEFENEGKILEGMRKYASNRSSEVESEVNGFFQRADQISKEFDDKTLAISKKHGYDSVDAFLSAK